MAAAEGAARRSPSPARSLLHRASSRLKSIRSGFAHLFRDTGDESRAVELQAEEHDADPNTNITAAVREGRLDAVQRLLAGRSDLESIRGAVGETLLHLWCV
jgi:hypothetical protein